MFTLNDLVQPETIEDAYQILVARKNNTVLGGCAFLRMGSQRFSAAVDLTKLGLNYIQEQDEYIEIGAMATFRDVEVHPGLLRLANGILPQAVGNVLGVQFRNVVTIGASVYSRYGFSDLITALLALETEIELYKGGRMSLAEFLDRPRDKDILTKIIIKKNMCKASYQSLRMSASDYPVLNVAVSNTDGKWTVAVGARPRRAAIAKMLSKELSQKEVNSDNVDFFANIAVEELAFGTNARGTAEYRKAMCKVLIKRAIKEVLQCK
ncbi:FAD binding domain-containing protein [Dendrosporobacter sp. 1207_IL3150]|uniref:FAD binding domain-containing protein n=1 Tax=Dendrosporobacter sp. 1207_IL3150 TaxID=3084054 RepID=UPI002FD94E68